MSILKCRDVRERKTKIHQRAFIPVAIARKICGCQKYFQTKYLFQVCVLEKKQKNFRAAEDVGEACKIGWNKMILSDLSMFRMST